MASQTFRTTTQNLVSLVTIALALAAPQLGLASNQAAWGSLVVNSLPPAQLMTEAMMGTQGGDAGLIGMFLGADANAPLQFTSFVDPTNFTFSFSLTAGSTYMGQPMTLSGSGSFDPNTGSLSALSSGTFGAESFSVSDSETWTNTTDGIAGLGDQTLSVNGSEKGRRVVTHRRFSRDGTSEESGHYVDEHGHRIPGSDFQEPDDYDTPDDPDWDFGTRRIREGGPYSVFSTGFSPLDGGAGSFTTTISPVPEPSSLLLVGSGMLGLAGLLRKRLLPRSIGTMLLANETQRRSEEE